MNNQEMVLKGKYGEAKVYTHNIDNTAVSQLITILNQSWVEGSNIKIMPDCHAGKGCVIGTTMNITDKICPNLVGVDIGCGMTVVELRNRDIDLEKLDKKIRAKIPMGNNVHTKYQLAGFELELNKLRCLNHISKDRALKSIGSLGGGNHFIEVGKGIKTGNIYLVVHSGSRYLGKQVAEYYQSIAQDEIIKARSIINGETRDEMIVRLKKDGKACDISKEIQKFKNIAINKDVLDLAYLEGKYFEDYIHDMKIVQDYAVKNRNKMLDIIVKEMGFEKISEFSTIHNYIDTDNKILRKGAISAQKGEIVLIPINMRDGSLICRGKGNKDWNFSAPHGAGRVLSRGKAKEILKLEDYENQMEEAGIYTTSVSAQTLDEAPGAYKPLEEIELNIRDTVDIIERIKPIYNIKA